MIAFLRSARGRWAVRLLALGASWLIATRAMGIAWDGRGHAFLVVMFLVVLLGIAYAIDIFVGVALTFAPAPPPAARPLHFAGSLPPLSQAKQAKVRKLVKAMAEAGVFAPEVPDAELAFAAFAVDKQPVDWVGVLQSLAEANYYHPECDPESWSANLSWDELPSGWQEPTDGRVLVALCEDEKAIFSRVTASSLKTLTAPMANAESWMPVDAAMLQTLRDAGVRTG